MIDDEEQEAFPLTIVLPMMKDGKVRYYPLWRREGEAGYRFYSVYKKVYTSYEYEEEARLFNRMRRQKKDFDNWVEE